EYPGPHVERLGGDLECSGDLLKYLGRGFAEAPLDLAQVRVRYAGHLGELAQRQVAHPSLLADELPEFPPPVLELAHGSNIGEQRPGGTTGPRSPARSTRFEIGGRRVPCPSPLSAGGIGFERSPPIPERICRSKDRHPHPAVADR